MAKCDAIDLNEAPPDEEAPCVTSEAQCAKLYLRRYCAEAGDNLYDHLSEVLSRILAERPSDVFNAFDEHSRRLRSDKCRTKHDYLRDICIPPYLYEEAKKLIQLFKFHLLPPKDPAEDEEEEKDDEDEEEEEEDLKMVAPNMFDVVYYFEQTDIGIPRNEIVRLNLSIKKLMRLQNIQEVRFWGKILGKPKNYYIVEARWIDEELERKLQELEGEEGEGEDGLGQGGHSRRGTRDSRNSNRMDVCRIERAALDTAIPDVVAEDLDDGGEEEGISETESLKIVFPPLPVNEWKPVPEVCTEQTGTGANEKVYFVCNRPGLQDWVELPDVTPQQIVAARKIVHLFTGDLDTEIYTYPPFPGNEMNYLRAQIARISASTHVSPIGYFTLGHEGDEEDEEEIPEEEDEEEGGTDLTVNKKYKPPPLKELLDASMSNWCHHVPFILRQGRVEWQDPRKVGQDEDEEEEEEEEEEEDEEGEEGEEEEDPEFRREIPPPLLSPLSEDVGPQSVKPWAVRQSSMFQPDTAVAFIRSNLWPGAVAYAADKKFGNLYIGWGHKHNAYNYSPPAMPPVEDQYPHGPELMEIPDPTFEEEEAYRIAHLPPEGGEEEGDEDSEIETEEDE